MPPFPYSVYALLGLSLLPIILLFDAQVKYCPYVFHVQSYVVFKYFPK